MRHRIRWESKSGKLFVNECEVDIAESQSVVIKSRDFSFGYGGSGPSQSALAILLCVTDRRNAMKHFQAFKEAFTAQVSADEDWQYFVDIDEWLAIHGPINLN